jgi:hypothetical protein
MRRLHSTNAIIDACREAGMRLAAETDRIKSLRSYPWIEKFTSWTRRYQTDASGSAMQPSCILSTV